jgi:hypothetical protein
VPVDTLRGIARFEGAAAPDAPPVSWLFETLSAWDAPARCAFLDFVSARGRLPPSTEGLEFKIHVSEDEPLDALPTAATCFFKLTLGRFSSKEVFAQRLDYAIRNCRSIEVT